MNETAPIDAPLFFSLLQSAHFCFDPQIGSERTPLMPVRIFGGVSGAILAVASTLALGQSSIPYQKPPQAIVDLLEAPPTPLVMVSPEAKGAPRILLVEQPGGLLTIAMLRRDTRIGLPAWR